MYLLDTNVLSELRKRRPHGGVLAWLNSIDNRDISVSAVSFGEVQAGIELTRTQDPAKAAEIESWADQIVSAWNVLPMDSETFRVWAKLMHRRTDDLTYDAMIAATALVHRRIIVTRNIKDFQLFGVEMLDPYVATDRP